jgi:hypothetical protein
VVGVLARPRPDSRCVGGGAAVVDVDDGSPVPPQFLGQARLARQHYAPSVAVSPQMQAIANYCRGVYAGGGSSRVRAFTEKRWRQLPGAGLVLQQITVTGSKLRIRDVRACTSTLWRPSWDEPEPGICLIDNFLLLEKKRLSGDAGITVVISLHAMGRWHQRQLGGAGTLEALTLELGHLAEVAPALIAAREKDLHVEVASGSWHGHVAHDVDRKRLPWVNIRTFY